MLHCTILVAIGANLPGRLGQTPVQTCDWAVDRLAELPGLRLVLRSHWYRSSPVPPSGQPDYINGAVRLSGAAEPHALLALLHAIEAEAGRRRAEVNAARTLDLDLLAVDGLVIDTAGLVLPHPRLQDRAFVLLPLAEVAPGWVHPRLGPLAVLVDAIDKAGVEALAPLDRQGNRFIESKIEHQDAKTPRKA